MIGAGSASSALLQQLRSSGKIFSVLGILDDDPSKSGSKLMSVPILGGIHLCKQIICENLIDEVIISIEEISSRKIGIILDQIDLKITSVRIIPTSYEIKLGSISPINVRKIFPEDLLGRKSIQLDSTLIHDFFLHKTILVTGAGGSIGSEICKQILCQPIKKLIALDISEYFIYKLKETICDSFSKTNVQFVLANIQDSVHLQEIFLKETPCIVFHAAAHKHVPLMEENERQAIKNNVCGTAAVVQAAILARTQKFIFISTDKAVNPSSVMGASKRLSECILTMQKASPLQIAIVRFGNVLASSGSVVPLFKKQILKGGPITVTHPDVVRYFMTVQEAGSLVTHCCAMAVGGEKFLLDMGEPVKIDDLVRKMIRLYGHDPEKDIKIQYTGLRDGEKLVEELLTEKEVVQKTHHEKIFVGQQEDLLPQRAEKLLSLLEKIDTLESWEIRKAIWEIIPEFTGYLPH